MTKLGRPTNRSAAIKKSWLKRRNGKVTNGDTLRQLVTTTDRLLYNLRQIKRELNI